MPFQIIRNDITQVKADVIVNTANPKPMIGAGTDAAIYAAAGAEKLLAKRRKIGEIAPGSAAVTPAFHLQAKHIIHTVGPVWMGGTHGEREILRACYANSLALAVELSAKSIAFPLIASGVYGFPKDEALNIALAEIGRFLLNHEMKVILVVFDRNAFELSEKLVGEIDAYIDDHGVAAVEDAEFGIFPDAREQRRMEAMKSARRPSETVWGLPDNACPREERKTSSVRPVNAHPAISVQEDASAKDFAMPLMPMAAEDISLDETLRHAGETFQQRLLQLIDRSGMTDAAVYKKANIDRRVFSKIRSRKDYKPKKVTAVAFAIALELDMETMKDLLSRAGFAFSPSDRFDLIISYFVSRHNYDLFEINAALFKYDQPILGEA